jgi:hypothetical protein
MRYAARRVLSGTERYKKFEREEVIEPERCVFITNATRRPPFITNRFSKDTHDRSVEKKSSYQIVGHKAQTRDCNENLLA